MQGISDDSYKQFIKDIAENRNLEIAKEKEWADGKIFTGNQALKLKLIDKLGSLQDAIDEIKKQARKEHKEFIHEETQREKEEGSEQRAYYEGLEEMQDLNGENREVSK